MIALVRHADAGKRGGADDIERPLSGIGRAQAAGLVAQLARVPLARVLASPYVRCRQTVEPLAAACGLPVEDAEVLAEGHGSDEVLDLIHGLAPGGAALCTHGDVIGSIVARLEEVGLIDRRAIRYPKGSTWLLEFEEELVISARYLAPDPEGDD